MSKTHPAALVEQALAAGQRAFGENYVQEALEKMDAHAGGAEWHLIGPLQSNKTRIVARALRLGAERREREDRAPPFRAASGAACAPLNVLIQVNVSGEASKSGVAPDEVSALAEAIHATCRACACAA